MQRRRISPGGWRCMASFCGVFVLILACVPQACAEEEETDFEFDDNLELKRDGDNITFGGVPPSVGNKTADEAVMLMDDPGSGPDGEDEMSGSSPPTSSSSPPTRYVFPIFPTTPETVTGEIEYFRCTINFTSMNYSLALSDRSTSEFLQLAFQIQFAVEKEFEEVHGKQSAVVLQFRPGSLDPEAEPSIIATIDFTTSGNYNRLELFNVLNAALNRGSLGSMRVSPHGFSFRPIGGL